MAFVLEAEQRALSIQKSFTMKFGKLLKTWAEEEMPQQSDLFLRFKELKKQLKLIKPPESGDDLMTLLHQSRRYVAIRH